MALSSKSFKYSVVLNIFSVDAPGTIMPRPGDMFIKVCLLGQHQKTKLVPAIFPLMFDQRLIFEKVFNSCFDQRDVFLRLEREHVLIELLQASAPTPVVLATYETSAKDFLYKASLSRLQYIGASHPVFLERTIDFPGIKPSLWLSACPTVVDVTGIVNAEIIQRYKKSQEERKKKRSNSYNRKKSPSTTLRSRPTFTVPANLSQSLTSHTIASAVKSDYAKYETQRKLRELAIPGEVKYVVNIDKTNGREPFVVRHVKESLIGRTPKSYFLFKDGLVVNDYSLNRPGTAITVRTPKKQRRRPRSASPTNRARNGSRSNRPRSSTHCRQSIEALNSPAHQSRPRSKSPYDRKRSESPRRVYNHHDYAHLDNEIHSTKDCEICRLHRQQLEQSARKKYLAQQNFISASQSLESSHVTGSHYQTQPFDVQSPILSRSSFRDRFHRSPAADLSEKVIHTLRRNIDCFSNASSPGYYATYHESDIC